MSHHLFLYTIFFFSPTLEKYQSIRCYGYNWVNFNLLNIAIKLLGINGFTFLLAALIIFFLSMNIMLGPGWLGSKLGIPGTGSIQEVSPSLPGSIDLNKPEFRL